MTSSKSKSTGRLKGEISGLLKANLKALLRKLSAVYPRHANRWAFGHLGGEFVGNSKYLFLWIASRRPDIQAVWITDNADVRARIRRFGFEAHARRSLAGLIAALRSKVFVFCHAVTDVNLPLSGGAFLLNLWHGVGLKPTELGDKTGLVSQAHRHSKTPLLRNLYLQYLIPPSWLVSTSEFTQTHFAEQFGLPSDRCPPLGYPRLDPAIDAELRSLSLTMDRDSGFEFNPRGFSEIYIYMPTYRDTGRPFLTDALPDLHRLSAALRARNALLYLKLHPKTVSEINVHCANIIKWPSGIDIYTYLGDFTCLITDYSSVLYDYLFVRDTGAILYTFDFAQYMRDDRPLLYPFDEHTAGVRVETFHALCDTIEQGTALQPDPKLKQVRAKFWGDLNGPASPRIVAAVERHLRVSASPLPSSAGFKVGSRP